MNIKQALQLGTKKLSRLENSQLETEVLLLSCLSDGHQGRVLLKTEPERSLGLPDQLLFRWRLWQRQRHVPVAYIINRAEWNDLELQVNRCTLIPRDETEILCHHIKAQHKIAPQSILDIGTGSGCIAIWLKQQFRGSQTTALDISRRALKVARYNATGHQVDIHFKRSDLLSVLPDQSHQDLIVANLPYVPEGLAVTTEVGKEPRSAIFSGLDGLNHIRALEAQIKNKKISFNQLWLEFLPQQTDDIKSIFNHYEVAFFTGVDEAIFFAQITPPA